LDRSTVSLGPIHGERAHPAAGKTSWLITKISPHAHRTLAETLAPVGGQGFEFALLAALEEFGPELERTGAARLPDDV
jgi:hypothetical protein